MTKLKKLLAVLIAVITAVVYMPITANAATDEMEIYSIYLGDGNNGDSTLVKSGDEYLLMDVGVFESYSYVDEFLQSKGVTHFSLYLSHFHGDHTGGFTDENGTQPLLNLMSKYEIDNIYLPDPSLLKYKGVTVEEEEETYYRKIQEFYESSDIQSGSYDSKVQYLELGSSFSFGSVDVSIIGPVNPDGFTSPFENGGTTGTIDADKLDEYQNNCSLVAKLVCGNTSFLSAGDTKTEGENSLISKYKNTSVLKSDIYKMSHHGFSPANSETFLSYVQPDYSFASNCSGAGLGETGNYWMINTARKNCAAYGFVYMLGQEKKSLNISVSDDTVSLYREGSSTKLNSQGWCKVYGNDGKNRQYDYYYFGADGKTLSGVQKIDGKYYYLSSGGYRYSGTGLTSNNNYKGMVTCEDGNKRYFLDSTDEMVVGFKEIDDGTYDGLYYFASNGVLQTSTNNGWEKMKIGSYYYSVYKSGFISQNVFKQYGSGYCYFGSDGKMATGWKTIDGKKYYLDPSTGYRKTGLNKISGSYYMFSDYGVMVTSAKRTDSKGVRYFGSDGKMATGWTKISGKKYYFNTKSGYAYTGLNKISGSYYMFSDSGVMVTSAKRTDSKGIRYFGSDGKMATGWTKISGKKYYFNTKSGYAYTGLKKISGSYYYFSDYGIMQTSTKKTVGGKTFKFGKDGKMTNVPSPSKTSISKLKASSKSFTVSWKKKSNVDGYEIYISTSKNGTYEKAATVSKKSTTSTKIKNLKKGKKYYVKVRTYSKVGSYKVYSSFSSVKSVKVK